MSWVKIDDRYAHHPKIHDAGPIAAFLDVAGMCHAARLETDGYIPASALSVVAPCLSRAKALQAAAKLVEVGRWAHVNGGWQIHDFLEYNPSAAEREAKRQHAQEQREAANERMRRHRKRKSDAPGDTSLKRSVTPPPGPIPDPPKAGMGPPKAPHPQPPSGPASPPSATPGGDADSAGHPQPPPGLTSTNPSPGDQPKQPVTVPAMANGALPPAIIAEIDTAAVAAFGPTWRRHVPSETDQDPAEFEAKREQKLIEFRSAFAQELNENANETEPNIPPEGRADEPP